MFCMRNQRMMKSESIDFFTGIPTPAGAILILTTTYSYFIGYEWAYENINIVAGLRNFNKWLIDK